MNVNMRTWSDDERRSGSLTVLVAAAAILVAGVALWYFEVAIAGTLLWVLVGLVAILLVYEVLVLALASRSARADAAVAHAGPAATAAEAEAATSHGEAATGAWASGGAPSSAGLAGEAQILTLKCGECGTVFDVSDTGERPLYHTCPGCGAEGVLRGESAAPAPAAPAAEEPSHWAPPGERAAPPQPAPAPAPAAPAAAPQPKRLKLRCGACKNVFALDDTGERPLRHRCPSCGKLGEIR